MERMGGAMRGSPVCLFAWILVATALQADSGLAQAQTAAVPDNFLAEPKLVHIDLGFSELFAGNGSRLLRLEGANATTGAIKLGAPVAGPVLRSGSPDVAVAMTAELSFGQNSCAGSIQPRQTCALTLQLPPGIGPGAYGVDVALSGADGGQSLRSVKFEIRSSAWLAGILVALGVVLGAAVTDWRTAGLPATDRRIIAADLRTRALRLAGSAAHPSVRRQAIELARQLRAFDADLIQGKDLSAKLTETEDKIEKLASCEQALAAADNADRTSEMFGTLTARLTGALDVDDWSSGGVEASLAVLRAELVQFPQLVAAVRRLDAEIARLQGAVDILGSDHAAIAAEWSTAQAERNGAFKRLTGASGSSIETSQRMVKVDAAATALADKGGAVAAALLDKSAAALDTAKAAARGASAKQRLNALGDRLSAIRNGGGPDRLAQAIALWRQVAQASSKTAAAEVELEAVATDAAPASVLPKDSELKVVFGPEAFQPAIGSSPHELRAMRGRWNMVTNILVLVAIAATGVLVLWVRNPAWGSVADMAGALLAGAATRMAIGNIAVPGGKG